MSIPLQLDVSIIIVNWNTAQELEGCIRSFRKHSEGLRLEYIVVDNASTDGSVSMVKTRFPSVQVLANSSNEGFAAAVNRGIAAASGRYLMVLNPDVLARPGALMVLLQALDAFPVVGAVAPRLLNPDGSLQEGYFRKFPTFAQVLLFYTWISTLSKRSRKLSARFLEDTFASGRPMEDVQQIPGGCIMLRREVLSSVGPMDPSYGLFFEDVDWCYRMRQKGWGLKVVNTVGLVHLGGRSFAKREDREWMFARFLLSLNMFFDKHRPLPVGLAVKCVTMGNSLLALSVRGLEYLFLPRSRRNGSALAALRKHLLLFKLFYRHYISPRNGRSGGGRP